MATATRGCAIATSRSTPESADCDRVARACAEPPRWSRRHGGSYRRPDRWSSDTLAHDIDDLLTIVAVVANGWRPMPPHPEQRADLQRIAVATAHAGSLTTRSMQSGRDLDPARPASDPTRAIADVVTLLHRRLAARSASICTLRRRRDGWQSDAELSRVLINLALNARDAMAGGGVLSVTTTAAHVDTALAERHRLTPGDLRRHRDCGHRDRDDTETRAQGLRTVFHRESIGGTGPGLASVSGDQNAGAAPSICTASPARGPVHALVAEGGRAARGRGSEHRRSTDAIATAGQRGAGHRRRTSDSRHRRRRTCTASGIEPCRGLRVRSTASGGARAHRGVRH